MAISADNMELYVLCCDSEHEREMISYEYMGQLVKQTGQNEIRETQTHERVIGWKDR